ncbi:U34-theraphotoxin-Cg1a [Parasteatoda tepidariorum]|uniref:U34-theraphotoxin-Cg1a n=1 Tax=Parasteatoda tepidariorum TaxID=114398 RepID=UPI00077F970B|nr:U34-theraphotoxin-Cg1a [Parasteatoda tepidariorum]
MNKCAFLLFLGVAAMVTRVSVQTSLRPCQQQSDCNIKEECCVNRKNELYCQKRRQLGESCSKDLPRFNGIYNRVCPCNDGLECRKRTETGNLPKCSRKENLSNI